MVYLKKKYYFPVGRGSNIFQGGGGVQLLFPMENYMYRSRKFPWWSAPPPPLSPGPAIGTKHSQYVFEFSPFILMDYLKHYKYDRFVVIIIEMMYLCP